MSDPKTPVDVMSTPVTQGVFNAERTRGWSVSVGTQVGERVMFEDVTIEVTGPGEARIVEDSEMSP